MVRAPHREGTFVRLPIYSAFTLAERLLGVFPFFPLASCCPLAQWLVGRGGKQLHKDLLRLSDSPLVLYLAPSKAAGYSSSILFHCPQSFLFGQQESRIFGCTES